MFILKYNAVPELVQCFGPAVYRRRPPTPISEAWAKKIKDAKKRKDGKQ